jgi:hypothetical protein
VNTPSGVAITLTLRSAASAVGAAAVAGTATARVAAVGGAACGDTTDKLSGSPAMGVGLGTAAGGPPRSPEVEPDVFILEVPAFFRGVVERGVFTVAGRDDLSRAELAWPDGGEPATDGPLDDTPVEPDAPSESASATAGVQNIAVPTPKATASAPTRPALPEIPDALIALTPSVAKAIVAIDSARYRAH